MKVINVLYLKSITYSALRIKGQKFVRKVFTAQGKWWRKHMQNSVYIEIDNTVEY